MANTVPTPATSATRDALVERVRALLAGRMVREVRMFGGLSFMVDEQLVVAARGEDELLVRVDPQRQDELLARPGARPATMGKDREMGPGWLAVSGPGLADDVQLASWVEIALEHQR